MFMPRGEKTKTMRVLFFNLQKQLESKKKKKESKLCKIHDVPVHFATMCFNARQKEWFKTKK